MDHTVTNVSYSITDAFAPTAELRFLRPHYTTVKPDRLQQLWQRTRVNVHGHVVTPDLEWRDVPVVIEGT